MNIADVRVRRGDESMHEETGAEAELEHAATAQSRDASHRRVHPLLHGDGRQHLTVVAVRPARDIEDHREIARRRRSSSIIRRSNRRRSSALPLVLLLHLTAILRVNIVVYICPEVYLFSRQLIGSLRARRRKCHDVLALWRHAGDNDA